MDTFNELPRQIEAAISRLPEDAQLIQRATALALLAYPALRDRLRENGELAAADVRELWTRAAAIWSELSGRDRAMFTRVDRFDNLLPLLNFLLWLCEKFPEGSGYSDPKNYPPTPEGELQRLRMISLLDQYTAGIERTLQRQRRRGDPE